MKRAFQGCLVLLLFGGLATLGAVDPRPGKYVRIASGVEFYNPGRPIGGRACPRTIQIDRETIGTVFYDTDEKQAGGAGVFFLRTPIATLGPRGKRSLFPHASLQEVQGAQ